MAVAPFSADLFEICKQVHTFLSRCQQQAAAQQQTKLVNVSFGLDAIAPRGLLKPWGLVDALGSDQQFCYIHGDCWLVALEAVLTSQAEGLTRFARMQQFVDVWRNRTVCYDASCPGGQPYFFAGFTFFDKAKTDDPARVFVPRLQVTHQSGQVTVSFNSLIDDAVNVAAIVDEFHRRLQQLVGLATTPGHLKAQRPTQRVDRDLGDFRRTVRSALKVIDQKSLRKVVLADAMEVLSVVPFQVAASLRSLAQQYPDCHVFSFSNGSGQTFLGASPELLLSIRQGQLVTDALAGSAPRGQDAIQDRQLGQQLLASPKERDEHQIVLDFIVRQLRSLGLCPNYPTQPTLKQLANIQHLHTPIEATIPNDLEALTILAQLHPTPAVAGLPRAVACDLIHQLESFDRDLYAAPLGWVDASGDSTFIVGIRSALLSGRNARLYGGAGIVAGSDPDKELAEIRLKLQAMLSSLV
ncbi:MAG: isochorismate synthase [Cyanobacteria bacterium P01_A01_bin.105]